MASQYKPAAISDNELEEIKSLEKDIDKVVVAVEQPPTFAQLSEAELARVQQAEEKMGVVMLAYDDTA